MTKINQIYKCNVCGNIIEVLHTGVGELVCCEQPMELLEEKTQDEGSPSAPFNDAQGESSGPMEKHAPVIEKTDSGVKVKVGSVPHPMEESHYIEWIELIADGRIYRKFLKAGEAPEAEFEVTDQQLTAREYCNVHGLWKSQ